jgi:DNA-3-methyladenine glycosylase
MRARRVVSCPRDLTNGPAKLCAALGIGRELDAVNVCDAGSALFIARNTENDETRRRLRPLEVSPRIGITKAAHLPLRFCLRGSKYVSRG